MLGESQEPELNRTPSLSTGAGVAGEANPPATRFNPCDYPLCWTFPSMLSHNPVSAWIEHIPFAFALMQMVRPRCLVELGVQAGDSFLAFCQAVKTLELEVRCYGVDHWQGDGHTGAYGPEVLEGLREYHEPRYGGFSLLVQSTFDEAVRSFPDGSIDLLHIDGWHTYEAVRHDFETWQPKLSPRAVVLFHDTNVRGHDFGVWRLWQELSAVYPHFEFMHGNGLGVLVYGKEAPPAALQLAGLRGPDADTVRHFYFTLGHKLSLALDLNQFRDIATESQSELADCRKELAQRKAELAQREAELAQREAEFTQREAELAQCKAELTQREAELAQCKAELALITGSRVWRFRKCLSSLPVFKQVAWHMRRKGPAGRHGLR